MISAEELGNIHYIQRCARRIRKGDIETVEFYNMLAARDEAEDIWGQLDDEQKDICHDFDRAILERLEFILAEHWDLPDVRDRMQVERKYWWYYIDEIRAGTLELPADLKGAA